MSRKPDPDDDWLDLPEPPAEPPLALFTDDQPDDDGLLDLPDFSTQALAPLPEDIGDDGDDGDAVPALPAAQSALPEAWADDPILVPWRTHALLGEPGRRVPTRLDPSRARSQLIGPAAKAGRTRIELAGSTFWLALEAGPAPSEALLLGRDALAGRFAITCTEGDEG